MGRGSRAASSYASCSTPSADESTSPTRSRIATPPLSRTDTSSSCTAIIVASSQVQDELERASAAFAGHDRLVDHLLDQEEPPAARRLLAGELGRQVGSLGRAQFGGTTEITDLH